MGDLEQTQTILSKVRRLRGTVHDKEGDRKEVILLMFLNRLVVTTRDYEYLAEYELKDCRVEEIKESKTRILKSASKSFQLSEMKNGDTSSKVLKHRFKFSQNEWRDLVRWKGLMDEPNCRDVECMLNSGFDFHGFWAVQWKRKDFGQGFWAVQWKR